MCGTAFRLLCPALWRRVSVVCLLLFLSRGGFISRALAPFHGFTLHSVSWVKGWVECTDFITSILWFYEEKGWCIISKSEREGRKQEENMQHLCIRVDVRGKKERAGERLRSPAHLSYSELSEGFASYSRGFHTAVTLVFLFVEGWPLFLKTTNWIWFKSAQYTQWINLIILPDIVHIPLSSKSIRKIISGNTNWIYLQWLVLFMYYS